MTTFAYRNSSGSDAVDCIFYVYCLNKGVIFTNIHALCFLHGITYILYRNSPVNSCNIYSGFETVTFHTVGWYCQNGTLYTRTDHFLSIFDCCLNCFGNSLSIDDFFSVKSITGNSFNFYNIEAGIKEFTYYQAYLIIRNFYGCKNLFIVH